ncbi:hypothetical protein MBLNU457_g2980t1 [Dothideomycetes sp. NU457]
MSGNPKSRSPRSAAKRKSDDNSGSPMAQTAPSTPSVAEHTRDRQPAQVNFEFLNFSHPSEAKASGARRTVRSHVTRQQHQKEQQAAAARRTKSSSQVCESSSLAARPSVLPTYAASSPGRRPSPGASPLQHTSGSEAASSVASTSGSPLHSPIHPSPVQIHPFDVYPVQWHSSIPIVVEHYLDNLAQNNPDLDGPYGQGLLRSKWFPFVLTNATLLHSVMLLGASHYESEHGSNSHGFDIFALRSMAISGMNEHLLSPTSSLSDELVGSILHVAAYEALFGDRDAFAMHMSGLQKIVELRGGLSTLGLDGLLERMLLWVDVNASFATGFDIFFNKRDYPTPTEHPPLNMSLFGARRDSHTRP